MFRDRSFRRRHSWAMSHGHTVVWENFNKKPRSIFVLLGRSASAVLNTLRPGMCISLRICAKCAVLRCFCAFCAKQNSAEQFKIAQKTRKTSKILCLRAKQRKILHKFCAFFAKQRKNFAQILRIFH